MPTLVNPAEFSARHYAALQADEARHSLLLNILAAANKNPSQARLWSFGPGARCAGQTPPHLVVIGDLTSEDASKLAEDMRGPETIGLIGPEPNVTECAIAIESAGVPLRRAIPQRIHTLTKPPIFPESAGYGRPARADDLEIYIAWTIAFCIEADLPEGAPGSESLRAKGVRPDLFLWEADGQPVAMAALNRQTENGGNIGLVYTPPGERGRGYGGSITAFVAQVIFARGKSQASLNTDLRNPISNHVYAKIGFRPLCDFTVYRRPVG